MTDEERAIDYVVDRMLSLGVAASKKEVDAVLYFMGEYYANVWQPEEEEGVWHLDDTEDGMQAVIYTDKSMEVYLSDTLPDVPADMVRKVLDAQNRFIEELMG